MNINKFIRLEYLSGTPLLYILIITGVLLFIFVFNLIYSSKKAKIISTVLFLISSSLLVGFFLYLKPYMDITSLFTPATRDYEVLFGYKKPYLKDDIALYRNGYFLETFNNNPLYEYKEEHIPIDYLGINNGESIFKFNDEIIFTYSKVVFKDIDNANILIRQYFLKDSRFIKEGFVEKSPKFFMSYEVSKNSKNLMFEYKSNKINATYDKSHSNLIHTLGIKYP